MKPAHRRASLRRPGWFRNARNPSHSKTQATRRSAGQRRPTADDRSARLRRSRPPCTLPHRQSPARSPAGRLPSRSRPSALKAWRGASSGQGLPELPEANTSLDTRLCSGRAAYFRERKGSRSVGSDARTLGRSDARTPMTTSIVGGRRGAQASRWRSVGLSTAWARFGPRMHSCAAPKPPPRLRPRCRRRPGGIFPPDPRS